MDDIETITKVNSPTNPYEEIDSLYCGPKIV